MNSKDSSISEEEIDCVVFVLSVFMIYVARITFQRIMVEFFFFFYGDIRILVIDYAPAVYILSKYFPFQHFESAQNVKLIYILKYDGETPLYFYSC